MAFQVNDTTYSGTYAPYFITRATYGMDTVRKGLVHVVGDIKKIHTIPRLDYVNPLKPRMAVPVADDANPFTMDGKQIVPKSVDIYEEMNPRDLEENQLAEALSTTIIDREVPQSLQSQLVQLVMNRAGEQYENCIWMGSTSYAGNVPSTDARYQLQFFDGFLKRFVADPLINLSTISPVAITGSNIFDILDDLISEATKKQKALITDELTFDRMKFIVSPNTCTIFTKALATGTTFKGIALDLGLIPRWRGYRVERVAGMADNTILFLRANDEPLISNLYVGMNSMQDWQLKVGRTRPQDETFFIQGKFKWDIQYGWGQEIFMYTTLVSADFTA